MFKEHYINYNGSPVYVTSDPQKLYEVLEKLSEVTDKSVTVSLAPEHHKDNFRVRIVPELQGLF